MSLEQLWTSLSRQEFGERYFGRAPVAQPACAREFKPLFDWATLDGVLRQGSLAGSNSDVLVVRKGRLIPTLAPHSLGDARPLLEKGSSLVVRRAQLRHGGLLELATAFAGEFEGEVQIQLFVTPKGQRGFGWHYDAEHVFLVQTVGVKEYFLRDNTVNPRPTRAAAYDFSAVRRETTQVQACTLAEGDWLYIPRGWWHAATAHEDSLAISIGVTKAD